MKVTGNQLLRTCGVGVALVFVAVAGAADPGRRTADAWFESSWPQVMEQINTLTPMKDARQFMPDQCVPSRELMTPRMDLFNGIALAMSFPTDYKYFKTCFSEPRISYTIFYRDGEMIIYRLFLIPLSPETDQILLKEWIYTELPNMPEGSRYAWSLEGAGVATPTPDGGLLISSDDHRYTVEPIQYWNKDSVMRQVSVQLLPPRTVEFIVPAQAQEYPLLIDPTLNFGQWLGGSGDDEVRAMAITGDEIYAAGISLSSTNWEGVTFQGAFTGGSEGYVVEIADGSPPTLNWGQWLGGDGADEVLALAVTGNEIYVSGVSDRSTSWESVTFQGALSGLTEQFVIEIDDSGGTPALSWGQWLGGIGNDTGFAVAVNGEEIYAGGSASSSTSWESVTFQGAHSGGTEGYVVEIADGATPTLNWGQWLGGGGLDRVIALAVTGDEIYAAGYTNQSTSWEAVTFQGTISPAASEGFVVEIDDSGGTPVLNWGQWLGGSGTTRALGVAVNGDEIYVGGFSTSSTSWDSAAFQGAHSGGSEGFVVEIADGGTPTFNWGQWLGGTGDDEIWSVAVTGDEIYAAGRATSTTSWETPLLGVSASDEALVSEIYDGAIPTLSWTQWLGWTSAEQGYFVVVNGDEIYAGGFSPQSTGWESVTFQGAHSGASEGFVVEVQDILTDDVKYFTGFETGDGSQLVTQGTNNTVVSSQARSGTYSNSNDVVSGTATTATTGLDNAVLYGRFGFRVNVAGNPSVQQVEGVFRLTNSGGTNGGEVRLVVATDGTPSLRLHNLGAGAQVGSDYTISADTWYYVELGVLVSSSVGELNMKVDGTSRASGTALNTGTGDMDRLTWSNTVSGTGGTITFFLDDILVRTGDYAGNGRHIARQGKAGSPTYDAWIKTGGAAINTVWSETPFSAANEAHSVGASEDQTMLVAAFNAGTNPLDADDTINACKVGIVALRGGGSSTTNSIRRIVNGVTTDTVAALTVADAYYQETTFWTDTMANINAAEIGGTHGSSAGYDFTVEDAWLMCDYAPVGGAAAAYDAIFFGTDF